MQPQRRLPLWCFTWLVSISATLPVIGFPGYGCRDDDVGERTSV
jgi:hypothetical protein